MAEQFQLKALIVGIDKLSPVLGKINRNMRGFQRQLKGFGKGGLALGATVGTGVAVASKAFADFEDAGFRLKGALMGANGAIAPEFEKINKLALELGNQLPGNTADFQSMMTALVQQGVTGEEILSGIGKAAAYLGVQLKMAPEQAAEFAAKMRTATGTTGEDMMGLMDVIQRTANLGVGAEDMLGGFAKLTPALSILKVKGLEAGKALAPLLAMAIRTGMQGESAGNAYRKMFQSFFNNDRLSDANQLLGGKGIRLDFTNGKGEFGGLPKMFEQLQKLRGLTTAERQPVLVKMFGTDSETLQVVNAMIENGMEGYDAMRAKLEAQASLQARVEMQLGSLKNLFEAAVGNAQNLLATVGESFSPEVKSLVSSLGGLSGWAQDFVRNNPGFLRALVAVAGALAILKVGALGLAAAMGVVAAFSTMSGIGIALRLIAIAAGLIAANWEKIGPAVKAAWGIIKPILRTFNLLLTPILGPLQALVGIAGMFGGSRSSAPAPAQRPLASAISTQGQKVGGAIDIRFGNAPKGTEITGIQTVSGVALKPSVGYSSYAWGMP